MFNMKNMLGLSDSGYLDFKRGVFACVLSNLAVLPSFAVLLGTIITLLDPFLSGKPLDTERLWLLAAAGVVCAIICFIAQSNEYDKTYTVAYSEAEKIRIDVAERLRKLPQSFFNNRDLSELTANIMEDCASAEHTMSHVAPGLFANIITVTLTCVILAAYDRHMALALFVPLPVAFGLIIASRKLQDKLSERLVKAKLNAAEQVQEYLEGIKVVKAFGLSGEKSDAITHSFGAMRSQAMKFEGIAGSFITLAIMILQVGLGFVTLVGTTLLTGGEIHAVKFLVFVVISAKIYSPLIVVLTLLPEFFHMLISTRRMRELRQTAPMTGDKNTVLTDFTVELENISFSYNDDDVIKNVSLTIPQGGVTAFVGPSGSGKTTISRLIARFWDVREGKITIGGKDIRGIEPERLMSYMSFVFQDVVLFNDTVINNIRIGKQGASDEEVYNAAKTARCDEFIRQMPQGYQTVIGENGSALSGGERQRISIARALLKNAPIVLLDEATASLDPENEVQIHEAVSELVKGRTVIVIAHRLRTVMTADKIAVLDNGQLVEEGTSAVLIKNKGLFERLYSIQQKNLGWVLR